MSSIDKTFCPQCGSPNSVSSKSCTKCGKILLQIDSPISARTGGVNFTDGSVSGDVVGRDKITQIFNQIFGSTSNVFLVIAAALVGACLIMTWVTPLTLFGVGDEAGKLTGIQVVFQKIIPMAAVPLAAITSVVTIGLAAFNKNTYAKNRQKWAAVNAAVAAVGTISLVMLATSGSGVLVFLDVAGASFNGGVYRMARLEQSPILVTGAALICILIMGMIDLGNSQK